MALPNFSDSIKIAFGRQLERFHEQIVGDTKATAEYAGRPFADAAVWAPGRMIDQVDKMLEAYRKNDNSQATQPKTKLPIMIAAMAKDFMPSGAEFGRGLGDPVEVMIPDDPKERVFRMRVVQGDFRTQIAIIAADEPSCRSLAMQLHLFMSAMAGRTFFARFKLAGIDEPWGVQIEAPDLMAVATPPADEEVKNMTIMAVDLTLRATIPFLQAPKQGEPNDGKGAGPNRFNPFEDNYDPSGYPVVIAAHGLHNATPTGAGTPLRTWKVEV